MVKFIIKRIALMFPLLIVVSFMTFMMTYLTKGDPAVTILHAQGTPNITPQLIAETREKYGFNEPILIQYMNWLIEAIQFKFGSSYITRESVSERIGPAFFNTFKLTLISSISVIITSILLGVISALTKGKLTDRIIRSIAFFLTALPSYWIASMLIIYISVKLNVLPTSGLTDPESYILPVLVVTITYAGIYFRNVRRAMIEQLNEDYVLYLRASGVHTLTLLSHVLRNALQVAVSIFCMSVPMIMGGLVVIENVFAWPGLGQLSIKAIVEHDFPVIQAYVLIVAVLFIIFNTLADIINAYLNPKLREAI
ncbi:ABC transporter permease subunit [Staphylococcus capitis]|uniref:nickel/cobalt ABC transporter permease n=1 Tax=Staphylococcus capitis TaxID=29388 RepID=UPI00129EF5B0|nr:nickel/cobalt ABC transporter permease [Staphylococcus capitis]MRN09682.1 ABC transporter permease subunit [Staphylococcus capitis]